MHQQKYPVDVKFEWDVAKNKRNIFKHGFDFNDAGEIFSGQLFVREDRRKDYGEKRWVGMGTLHEEVIYVIYTYRATKVRIISMRRANKRERKKYEKAIQSFQD